MKMMIQSNNNNDDVENELNNDIKNQKIDPSLIEAFVKALKTNEFWEGMGEKILKPDFDNVEENILTQLEEMRNLVLEDVEEQY